MSFLVKAYAGQLDRGTEVGTLGPCEANSGDKVSISTIVTSLLLRCDFLGLLAQKCPTLLRVFPKIKPTKKQTKKKDRKKPPLNCFYEGTATSKSTQALRQPPVADSNEVRLEKHVSTNAPLKNI